MKLLWYDTDGDQAEYWLKKSFAVLLSSSQTSHGLSWDRRRASAVRQMSNAPHHLHVPAALSTKTNGRILEPSKSDILSAIREHWTEKYFHLCYVRRGNDVDLNLAIATYRRSTENLLPRQCAILQRVCFKVKYYRTEHRG